jgi:hypothetical protein
MSRIFFKASAGSIASSAAFIASDLITTPATDALHFQDAALDALNDVPVFHHQPRS